MTLSGFRDASPLEHHAQYVLRIVREQGICVLTFFGFEFVDDEFVEVEAVPSCSS